jgi:hypothetical protein
MNLNTFNPTLHVGDTEITSWKSVSFKDGGKNQVTSISVSTNNPDLDNMALHGKEVTFYLNYGAQDTVPFFRGRIKQSTPTNKSFNFTAYDVRVFLTGKESLSLSITDDKNYDGYTLGQFLYEYIDNVVNNKETLIGLDMLNDTNPLVSLSNYRQDNVSPLKVIQDNVKQNRDSQTDIKNSRLVVRDDGSKSNICFVEEQSIDSSGIEFTYSDGINSINFKRRPLPNVFLSKSKNNSVVYRHNNLPTGLTTQQLKGEFDYPDQAVQESFYTAEYNKDKYELSIDVSKGHYLDIGNVISIDVPDFDYLSGKHRIISKNINVSSSGVKCTFKLSKEGPSLNEYI